MSILDELNAIPIQETPENTVPVQPILVTSKIDDTTIVEGPVKMPQLPIERVARKRDVVAVSPVNQAKYEQFALWMAVPQEDQDLKSQKDFGKKFKVSEQTLTEWKKNDSFWIMVQENRNRWARSHTSEVIGGLKKRAKTRGTRPEVELWMSLYEGYVPKTKSENVNANFTVVQILNEVRGNEPQRVE